MVWVIKLPKNLVQTGQYTKKNKTAEKLGPNHVTENGYKTRHADV